MQLGLTQVTGMFNQRNSPLSLFTPDPGFPGFFARVYSEASGSGSHSHSGSGTTYQAYSWEEVRPITDGDWETWSTARTGSTDQKNPAYEFNNDETPDGSIVWLWFGGYYASTTDPAVQIADMRFALGAGTGQGSGSGSGSGCCPECTDFCQEIAVPAGSGGVMTMYMRSHAGCVTIDSVPCGSAPGDVNCSNCAGMTGFDDSQFQATKTGSGGFVSQPVLFILSQECTTPYTHLCGVCAFQLCMTQEILDTVDNPCGWVLSDFVAAPRMWIGDGSGFGTFTEWELLSIECDPTFIAVFTDGTDTVTIRNVL